MQDAEASQSLTAIRAGIDDPTKGLPDPVFGFLLQVTPMINVDLLVRDEQGRALFAWRDDAHGQGWHLPGGIIRYMESFEDRIYEVARQELGGTVVIMDSAPCDIVQLCGDGRGHFISLLFRCTMPDGPADGRSLLQEGATPTDGDLSWISGVPDILYNAHRCYLPWLRGERL